MKDNIKVKIKENIQILIDVGNIGLAKELIKQYKKNVPDDIEMNSMEAIVAIMEGRLDDAENIMYNGLVTNNSNFDLLYNLAYLYNIKKEVELELEFYKKTLKFLYTNDLKNEIEDKIFHIKNNIDPNIDKDILKKYEYIIKEIDTENNNNVKKNVDKLLKNRNYIEIVEIFKYYLKNSKSSIGEMYYFIGYACNGLKRFQDAIKYHTIAIKVEPYLRNIADSNNVIRNLAFDERIENCVGCGHSEYNVVNVSNQSIAESNKGIINPIRIWVKCKKCNLVYGNPSASENSLNKYYSIIAKEKFGGIYGNIKEKESFLFEMSDVRLNNISRLTDKKTLLDIGTGIGFFVKSALNRGFDANGLELTPEDCEYAKRHYGLDLMQRNFYSFTETEQYDIVTMFEVIEHMRTPLKDLKRINKLVKMGGIFVIATPILDSEYAKLAKEENVFWNVVAHLSYFTKDVLRKYLKSAGFEVITIIDSMEGMGRMDFYCRKVLNL